MNFRQRKRTPLRPPQGDIRFERKCTLASALPALVSALEAVIHALRPTASGDLAVQEEPAPLYYDQSTSPLGRRRHLRLVRDGVLPGRKVGRRVFVKATDVGNFIEAHAPVGVVKTSEDDVLSDWGLKSP